MRDPDYRALLMDTIGIFLCEVTSKQSTYDLFLIYLQKFTLVFKLARLRSLVQELLTRIKNGSKTYEYRTMLLKQVLQNCPSSKRDKSTTFFKTFLQQSLKISLLLFADLLKATFPTAIALEKE